MLKEDRIGIYRYVEGILSDITENIYLMNEPQELTQSDTEDGFIVIRVGDLNDESEFQGEAFGFARVFVEVHVPPMSRGRLDVDKYTSFETQINDVIREASSSTNEESDTYWIREGSVVSMDTNETTNADNIYYMFIKSFIVEIDKKQ